MLVDSLEIVLDVTKEARGFCFKLEPFHSFFGVHPFVFASQDAEAYLGT